jgi:hypothetical protein
MKKIGSVIAAFSISAEYIFRYLGFNGVSDFSYLALNILGFLCCLFIIFHNDEENKNRNID